VLPALLLPALVLPATTGIGIGIASAEAVRTAVVEDTDVGRGMNQVTYTSGWKRCAGCAPATSDGSFRYSPAGDATAVIHFSGTRLEIFGVMQPAGGQALISIDDFAPTVVDTYAPVSSAARIYESDRLADREHLAYIFNLDRRNADAHGTVVAFDRAEVSRDSELPTPGDGPRSGQPWLSGVNGDPAITPAAVDAFCDWRDSACDLAHVFVGRDSWRSVTRPSFAQRNFAGWPGRLVISVPPFPERSGASLAACADGDYDARWATFGETLNATRRQDSVVRIAWDANGDWYEWSASTPADYVGCWRHIADAINSTAEPDPLLDWTVSGHYSQNPPSHNPLELYPGDAWVDIVGIEYFDHFPSSRSRGEFEAQADDVGGITWLYDFTQAHGKRFGVGAWGVVRGGVGGGGDNPNFVQFMRDWFTARAGKGLYYENYYNNGEPGKIGSNLARPVGRTCAFRNPDAARRYRQLWQDPDTDLP
jgi:hypothetical protein